jgi:predicted SprT family Zn-dependent metalloprotease
MQFMMDRFEAVRARTQEVLAKAELLYGVKIDPKILFNLKGRVAGWAGCKFCRITRKAQDFTLRFNSELIQGKHFEDMMNLTIPHEVAHLTCYARPDLGAKHNPGWKRVCVSLGGSGDRTHSYNTAPARGDGFTYRATCGTEITVSAVIHRKIQMGQGRVLRKTKGRIHKDCAWVPYGQPVDTAPVAPTSTAQPVMPAQKVVHTRKQGELTWAEQVRRLIRAHKPQGISQETVIGLAIMELGMTRERARSCVKAHWDKF